MTVERPSSARSPIQAARSCSHGQRSASSSGVPALILSTLEREWKSSASAKSSPVATAMACATVVLPEPETPMTTTWRVPGPRSGGVPGPGFGRGAWSPVMDGAVLEAVERQVCRLVREGGGRVLIDLDTQARLLRRMQVAVPEGEGLAEHLVRQGPVLHVLLDAEVVDRQVQVQGRRHPDGGDVRGPVDAGLDLVLRGVVQQPAHRRDAAGMGQRRTHVVDR